jgi:hypothetical protein
VKPLLSRGFVVLAVRRSGYFRVSGIGAQEFEGSAPGRGWYGEQVEAGLVVAGDA